jgi:hypothetical protein
VRPDTLKAAPTDPALMRDWLQERLADMGAGTGHHGSTVATGWDRAGSGSGGRVAELRRGAVHEWFGLFDADDQAPPVGGRGEWSPPLLILAHLVRQSASKDSLPWTAWIGRRVWPTAHNLAGDDAANAGPLLRRAVLVDPGSPADRLWAIDAALRASPDGSETGGGLVVVADGSGLDMAGSRRLQLAAESGGAMALIARPPHELSRLSAASTRWKVSRAVSRTGSIAWSVRLVRGKGLPTMVTHEAALLVERTDAGQVVRSSSDVGHRSGHAAIAC